MHRITPKLILIFCLFSKAVFGQTESEKRIVREKMWQLSDAGFTRTQAPDKWKNESAVVLYRTTEYEVKKEVFLNYVYENLYTRSRIKLLDQAAVQDFSEMSFDASTSQIMDAFGASNKVNIFVGIKVIKPGGQEREITLKDAVAIEAKQGYNKEKYNKIAIPDLEPGDIIDYYRCVEKQTILDDFERVTYPLAGKYPVVEQKLDVRIMRKCYLNAKSLNGAPELKRNAAAKNEDLYTLVDKDREKINADQQWFYTYRSVPALNFHAYYVPKKSGWTDYFLGEQGEAHSTVTTKHLLGYVNMVSTLKDKYYPFSKALLNYTKTHHKKETDPEKIVREAYTHWRQRTFAANYEEDLLYNRQYQYGLDNERFVLNFSRFLQKKKISHDVLITTPRSLCDVKDLVLKSDVTYLIRVNTPKPFYIGQFGRYSQFSDVYPAYQGANAYAINMAKKTRERTIKPISIPATQSGDNLTNTSLQLSFAPEQPERLKVKRAVVATGQNRLQEMSTVVTPYEYLYDCRPEQYGIALYEKRSLGKKAKAEVDQKIAQRKEQDNKDRVSRLTEELEQTLGTKVASYDGFELQQTGLWYEQPGLKYQDEFTLEELLESNGPHLMLPIGKLIGSQVALKKEELTRKDDVYMTAARSFKHTITITVPPGYELKGLDKLNANVTNATGGFVSTAVLNNNQLTLTVHKYYAHNFEKAASWPDMVAFLEAAYQFSQQKVLFRKL
jgi:hypothetical protein